MISLSKTVTPVSPSDGSLLQQFLQLADPYSVEPVILVGNDVEFLEDDFGFAVFERRCSDIEHFLSHSLGYASSYFSMTVCTLQIETV